MIHCAVQLIHRARAEGVTDLRPVERNADSRQIACAGAAGVLEASDLLHSGIASRVAIDETMEARRALERLAELPPRQRRDLALRVAGFTYREIAKITGGRTYTNVNKHLSKARARIRLEELRDAGAKTRRRSSS